MFNKNHKKLKRILSSFAVGAAATSAVIPVIACSEDGSITGGDIEKAIEEVKKHLNDIEINDNGVIDNLPAAPEGTHWEYRVGDGEFSRNLPKTINPDDEIAIKLVNDDPAADPLPEEAEATVNVDEVITVDASAKAKLDEVIIYDNGTVENDEVVANTHLQYSLDNGVTFDASWPSAQDLEGVDQVVIRLAPDPDYEFEDNVDKSLIQTTVSVKKEVTVTSELVDRMNDVYIDYVGGEVRLYAPPAPEFTYWQYDIQSGDYSNANFALNDLGVGSTVKMRLVADEDHYLSQEVEKTNIVVGQLVPADEINKQFENVRIGPGENFANSLPEAPARTQWTYAVNEDTTFEPVEAEFLPTDLVVGDKIKFKLASTAGYDLDDSELVEHTVTVMDEVYTDGLAGELASLPAEIGSDASTLPAAPENSHWEFELASGEVVENLPTDLEVGAPINVQLVANENYYLNKPAGRTGFKFARFVQTSDELRNSLDQIHILGNDEQINGLPEAPANSHWEYQIIKENGILSTTSSEFTPVEHLRDGSIVPGDSVKVTLVPNDNYQLPAGETVEKLIKVETAVVDLSAPATYLDEEGTIAEALVHWLDSYINFIYDEEKINAIPETPEGSRWEYSIDGGEFTSQVPKVGDEYYSGAKALDLKFRLAPIDDRYVLSEPVEWSLQADGIVNVDGYYEQITNAGPTNAASNEPWLPDAPDHSVIKYNAEAYSIPNRENKPYVIWMEADEGWILSWKFEVYKNFI